VGAHLGVGGLDAGGCAMTAIGRGMALIGFTIGLAALITQFPLTLSLSMASGRTALASVVFFFSFFTILSNTLAVACFAATIFSGHQGLAFLRRPKVQTAVALYMLVVAIIYIGILEGLWAPEGLMRVLDTLLHYVMPALFLAFWLIFVPKGTTSYADLPKWLAFPFFYSAYVMIRGAFSGDYPTPSWMPASLGFRPLCSTPPSYSPCL
jgi:hypothetical protein